MCGGDELGLPIVPNLNHPLKSSWGHLYPGVDEHVELGHIGETTHHRVSFKEEECLSVTETWFTNSAKYKYLFEILKTDVFPQFLRIRFEEGGPVSVLPTVVPDLSGYEDGVIDPFPHGPDGKGESLDFGSHLGDDQLNLDDACNLQKEFDDNLNTFSTTIQQPSSDTSFSQSTGSVQSSTQATSVDSEPQFPRVSDRLNLIILGATCYANVVLQVISGLPELYKLVASPPRINFVTGRDPSILANDVDGSKHNMVFSSLAIVSTQLRNQNSPNLKEICKDFFKHVENLSTFTTEDYDEASYFAT